MTTCDLTPEKLIAWSADAVAAVPGLSWRSAIEAAAIMSNRIAASVGEDFDQSKHFIFNTAMPEALARPQPEFSKLLVEGLQGKPDDAHVTALLNQWWDIATTKYSDMPHQMSTATSIAIETVAALSRDNRMQLGIIELFSMALDAFAMEQRYFDRRPLTEVSRSLADAVLSDYGALADVSAPAFAAISVLTRCVHLGRGDPIMKIIHTQLAIQKREARMRPTARPHVIAPQVETIEVNNVLDTWKAGMEGTPKVDYATTLSAAAIDTLAMIFAGLPRADYDTLKLQLDIYLSTGPEALERLEPSENDNHAAP